MNVETKKIQEINLEFLFMSNIYLLLKNLFIIITINRVTTEVKAIVPPGALSI